MTIKMQTQNFSSFANNSNETQVECDFIINNFVVQEFNSRRVRVLDLGCGTGEKMHYLAPHTSYSCGIEICTDLIDLSIYNEIIIGNVLNKHLPINLNYNLAIASHILPYIHKDNYHKLIDNALSHLSLDGAFIIFEMTGDGVIGKIKEKVLGKRLITSADKFDKYLKEEHISHATYHLEATIKTLTCEKMYEVLKFFCEKYNSNLEKHSKFVKNEIQKLKNGKHYELNYHIKAYVFKNTCKG